MVARVGHARHVDRRHGPDASYAPRDGEVTAEAAATVTVSASPPNANHRVSSRAAWTPKDRLGRYLVIDEIGRGGMGVVLRAYDPMLQREVALKCVRTGEMSADAAVQLLREAQTLARLSHPNVIAVYDAVVSGDDIVMAMEYVRGNTLQAWLVEVRSWRDVIAAFIPAGRGLAAAHAAGLLHRDFKPSNVLMGADGRVRVSDFGLARLHTGAPLEASSIDGMEIDATRTGSVVGTPRYMAPEQCEGGVLDEATDQYAFCVALREALTRQRVFEVGDWLEVVKAKHQGPPPWPRDVALPRRLREAVHRGLAPDARARWPSMDALLECLSSVSQPRRRPWVLASSTLAAVGLTGAAWVTFEQKLALRCTGAAKGLSGVWDVPRRLAAQAAMLGTGMDYAEDAWRNVAPQLDAYASRWIAIHTETCEATTVRREQPAEVMDLAIACLHRARIDFRAATDMLASADAGVVEKAHEIVGTLPDLARCTDTEALHAEVAPPPVAQRETVDRIRARLAAVKALHAAGKYPQAFAELEPLVEQARAARYAPLVTEVQIELGVAHNHARRFSEAETAYREALRSALSHAQWQLAVHAANELVLAVGWEQMRPLEGLAYADTARSLLSLADPALEAELRLHIGRTLEGLGKFPEAETEHRAAIAIAEQRWGPQHLELAFYRANLGSNLRFQGRMAEAEREQREQIALEEQFLGAHHPDVANARFQLGNTLFAVGRYKDAQTHYVAALASNEKNLGAEHPQTTTTRTGVATGLLSLGRNAEAIAELERALPLLRESHGPDHSLVVLNEGTVAIAMANLGRYAEAETSMREIIAKLERLFGANHFYVAAMQSTLVPILLRRERFVDAESLVRRVLAVYDEVVGPDHPARAAVVVQLAAALEGQGRYREAEAELDAAWQLAERVMAPDHAERALIFVGRGKNLAAQGRHEEAEHELRSALKLQLEVLGSPHPDVAVTRGHLASTQLALGRHEDAEAEYREGLAVLEALALQTHPDAAALQSGLARTLIERGAVSEALPLLEHAWSVWRQDERVSAVVRARLALALAQTLAERPQARARARELARSARDLLQAAPGAQPSERGAAEARLRGRNRRPANHADG